MEADALEASLVRIRTKDGQVVGSGFLVGERHVLTCAHVITQALDLPEETAALPPAQTSLDFPRCASHTLLLARVAFWLPAQKDHQGDLAVLELLDVPPASAHPVRLAPADQVWDHPFHTLGFPAGYDDGVWATGRLLGRQGANWLQLEDLKGPGFPIMPGFSGAPVWDEESGGVVGMIVAASQPASIKTGFALPSDILLTSWPPLASLLLPAIPRNPYKGLRHFTQDDTRDFFGREALIETLTAAVGEMLTREQRQERPARLLAVLGASGSGKSSVVMAGLLPRLRAGGVPGSQDWAYLDRIIPGSDPLEALLITLKSHFPDTSFQTLRQDLEADPARGLHLLATQLVKQPGQRVVLFIDQFEEVFTLTADEATRRQFFALLVAAVTESHGPLLVILTLRADAYERLMQYPELYRLMDQQHVPVLPMEREELRRVIEGPVSLPEVQLTFESGLVETLLFAVEQQSGALFEHTDPGETRRMQETLETFIRARLLTSNQIRGTRTIEVSHEALLREWRRLAEWLREAREDILFQQSFSEDVTEWERHQRSADRLYRGAQLKEAHAWASRNQPSEQEAVFLRQSTHRQRLFRAGLTALVLMLVSSLCTLASVSSPGAAILFYITHLNSTVVTTLRGNGLAR